MPEQARDLAAITTVAEQALSNSLNYQIKFQSIEPISQPGRWNLLLRCHIAARDGLPQSVILKKVEADPYDPANLADSNTKRFFNDWVGTQFLNTISCQAAHRPVLYGGDRRLGFLLLEDIPHHSTLVEPLLGSDPVHAQTLLLQYARCLGQLHSNTVGYSSIYDRLFKTVSGHNKPPPRVNYDEAIAQIHRWLDFLEISIEPNFSQDLAHIFDTVTHPGPYSAYVHADACPDNILHTGKTVRLIDFEFGNFGHALIDAVFGRMMFPSCWCANRLPREIIMQMESTYRSELIQGCSAAEDDELFEGSLVNACGYWLLSNFFRHLDTALEQERPYGPNGVATVRQHILGRLEAFISTSMEFGRLSGLRGTASRLLDKLSHQWQDTPSMPLYPAFQRS